MVCTVNTYCKRNYVLSPVSVTHAPGGGKRREILIHVIVSHDHIPVHARIVISSSCIVIYAIVNMINNRL